MKTLVLLCATFAVIEGFVLNIKCKAPSDPYNGYYTPKASSYKIGSKISLRCNSFFTPRTSVTRTCGFGLFIPFTIGYCDPVCPSGYTWTSFYDRDNPSATGDHETLAEFIKTKPDLCRTPVSIDAREKATMKDYRTTGQKVSISPTLGLRCLNSEVKGQCKDYTVRFCCDQNECEQNLCDSNAVCSNTQGSYSCSCKSGYTGNGRTCADIDECQTSGICGDGAVCNNQPGSYQCSCPSGYTGDPEVQCTKATCPPPSSPENGGIVFAKSTYEPGDYIVFYCNLHYGNNAPNKTPRYECQPNGEWTGYKPVCVGSCFTVCASAIKYSRGAPTCGCNATCEAEGNCCSDYTLSCATCTSKCEDQPSCKCSSPCGYTGTNRCCHNYRETCVGGPGWPEIPSFTPGAGLPSANPQTGFPTRSSPFTWAVGKK